MEIERSHAGAKSDEKLKKKGIASIGLIGRGTYTSLILREAKKHFLFFLEREPVEKAGYTLLGLYFKSFFFPDVYFIRIDFKRFCYSSYLGDYLL